jgi:serine/threonine-protein kinase
VIPSQIAHYRVDRLIGVGGMGEVYLAQDATLHRKVALKLLPERFTQDPERVRRFQREAQAASALNHPNILTIYEVGQSEERHYIATEYIEGQTLRDRITADPPLSILEVVDIAIGVAGALAAAHGAGIIHRDIKPENIMLRPDGYVKVLDFGLAKLLDHHDSTTGALMGTLLYLSPEQARGIAPDIRSDVYSLGAVIYEMLTQQPPIITDSFVELAIAIASKDPKPPSAVTPGVPPELDQIIMKALQKDRAHRYASAREMLDDLRVLREELTFENTLTRRSGGDGKASGPLVYQQTAPLFSRHSTTAPFARISRTFTPAKLGAAALIVACVIVIAYAIHNNSSSVQKPIDSVAVLPFVNVSGDPNNEYLSDGIAESLMDSLAQLPQLKVVARSTAFRYRGKGIDPLQVGRDLNVRGVVSGQLMQRSSTIVIRVALIDVREGTQVWGAQYDRNAADVLSLQSEISERISNELRMKLSGEVRRLLARRSAVNPEAYEHYLKARYHLNKYTEETMHKSIDEFNRAIEIEPTYALAWAGLATANYGLSNLYMAPNEAMPRARAAAEHALQIDDTLAEAHTALALVLVWYDWDFERGEREFRRAIELNANDAEAHRSYGDFLIATGQLERAIAEKKEATSLDPLSTLACWDLGRAYFYAGRLAEADQQAIKTIDLDDRFAYAYMLRASVATQQGRTAEALALIQKAMEVGGHKPSLVSMWGYINARAGNLPAAESAINELQKGNVYTLPLFLARINAGLGRHDEAMRWLEKLFSERSESVVWLKIDPTMQNMRNDPRFQALIKRIGL